MIKDKHTLTTKYLLINYALGLIFTAIILMAWNYNELLDDERGRYYLVAIIVSFILFPFSRFSVEKIALLFSTKKFWTSGFFQDDAGQNGVRALFYVFCFTLAIPFGLGYLLYRGIQKCGLVRPHNVG